MAPNTTSRVAGFVADLGYDDIPDDVIAVVKRQVLDVVGVALAGMSSEVGGIVSRFAEAQASRPEATVWGTPVRVSAADAAWANGVAAHALDFDDIWLPGTHPSAPVVPAGLAVAESLHASGRDLVVALLAGYEVMGRLSAASSGRAGWHPTGIFGALGATATAAKLLGLDAARTAVAFGIASSHASGIDAHEGTMGKPLHAGLGARSGVVAALLAREGFTASPDVFDGHRGFFPTFYRGLPYDAWRVTQGLGRPPYYLTVPGIGVKPYPAGYLMQHAFEAALALATEHDLAPEDIAGIEITFPPASRFNRPAVDSGLEGKFSLQYVVVMALLDRALTIESFTDDKARSAPVQRLLGLTRATVDDKLTQNHDIWHSPVRLRTVDGRDLAAEQAMPRAHWRNTVTDDEVWLKFRANASYALDEPRTAQIRDAVARLESLEKVDQLAELLGARREED
jgi:2-methylcitrate dehydratase PrpD